MNDLAHLRIFAASPKCSLSENVISTKTSRVCSFNDLDKIYFRMLGDVKALRTLVEIPNEMPGFKEPQKRCSVLAKVVSHDRLIINIV